MPIHTSASSFRSPFRVPVTGSLLADENLQGATIPGLFEAQARSTPDAVALVTEDSELTYGELDRRANQLAHRLRRLGVEPEDLVAIAMDRSLQLIEGLLAILKVGGAYVSLDPDYPRERLRFMLEDTRTRVLLTRPHLAGRLPPHQAQVLFPETEELPDSWREGPPPEIRPEDLAYVCYTSGSTGRPKGVMVPHRGVVRLVKHTDYADFGAGEVFLQLAPISFDASTFEIWGPLLNGARLGIFPPGKFSLEELARVLESYGVSTLWLTAGLFHQVVDQYPQAFRGLRQLLAGGDVLSVPHVRRALEHLEDGRMINGYGPTENTTFTCCHPMADSTVLERTVPIGRPIAHTRVHLFSSDGPPPAGEPGELCAGGHGLARGYLGCPRQTAVAFVPDPCAPEPGERLYRTGDLARHLPDGELEFLGRIDRQVKVRGYRVEPGEIESALAELDAVQSAVVTVCDAAAGEKRLVAYVTAHSGAVCSPGALRQDLRERLPEWSVPSAFVVLDEMPLGPTGKIDRQALPVPPAGRPDLEQPFVAPRTPGEKLVAGIWRELLALEEIGVDDNLFELGGHSLVATRILARVRQATGVEVPITTFFETPTVATLAACAESSQPDAESPAAAPPPIRPLPRDGEIPLSFPQMRIWFLEHLLQGNVAYNAQITIHWWGGLRVEVLERAFTEIVRRHEILRTTFPARDGQPVQLVHPPFEVKLPVVSLEHLPASERRSAAEEKIAEELREPFHLDRLPLVRWTLFRLGPQEHLLLQVEHHFVHDGWSLATLLREMKALYDAEVAGRPAALPELPVQYADFALWQHRWFETGALEAQLGYWCERLAGVPPALELPTDRPAPRSFSFRGGALTVEVPAALYRALRDRSRREGVALFTTMLSAFYVLLYHFAGQEDLVVGSAFANRRLRETENLLGMVINMVLLRTSLGGDPTLRQLLRRVRRSVLEAHTNQDLPFEKLVEALNPERRLGHNPLFQVMFSFHDSAVPELRFADGSEGRLRVRQNRTAKADLDVVVIPRAEQQLAFDSAPEAEMTLIWEYSTDLFDATTIRRMWHHYRTLLESLCEHPEQRLSELLLLAPAARHWLVAELNDPRRKAPAGVPSIPELFAIQTQRTPEKDAVALAGARLTYGELRGRVARLARRLRARGVGPEVTVGLFCERSPDMVVGLLAVLEAGGVFVPLDPAHPRKRQSLILDDAGIRVVLTQPGYEERLPAGVAETLLDLPGAGSTEPLTRPAPEQLAYVIYTSGSTGTPKGVAVSHGALAEHVASMVEELELGPGDRVLQFANLSFDVSLEQILPPLICGATLFLRRPEIWSPGELWRAAAEWKLTVADLPTTYWQQLTDELDETEPPPSLRLISLGGEALPRLSWALWRRRMPRRIRLLNAYGPTEATITATRFDASAAPLEEEGTPAVAIGRPLPGREGYVLDRRGRPVPPGVAGELHLGGASLARGYVGLPARTAECFVPDPFCNRVGGRLYRTWDLARWRRDGHLEFLGRADAQVKVRGFRIELGEIEAVLETHPQLAQAAAGVLHGDRLVAYVVLGGGQAPERAELRRFLGDRLPAYMVPSVFVHLDALPLTANGKVDRKALPLLVDDDAALGDGFVAPRSPMEEELARIWSEVLGVPEVGIHDDFFVLGGHSLLAMQVVVHIRSAFAVELALSVLFESRTVASLAQAVLAAQNHEQEALDEFLIQIEELSDEKVEYAQSR